MERGPRLGKCPTASRTAHNPPSGCRAGLSPLRRAVLGLFHGDLIDMAESPGAGSSLDGLYGDLLDLPLCLMMPAQGSRFAWGRSINSSCTKKADGDTKRLALGRGTPWPAHRQPCPSRAFEAYRMAILRASHNRRRRCGFVGVAGVGQRHTHQGGDQHRKGDQREHHGGRPLEQCYVVSGTHQPGDHQPA
jgi:hypothetical protein